MPELPEVENVRLSLMRPLVGRQILSVQVYKPKLVSGSGTKRTEDMQKVREFEQEIEGEVVADIRRRAKNLLIVMESGKSVLIHLKMTGQVVYVGDEGGLSGGHPVDDRGTVLPHKHTHIIFTLDRGTLYYNDIRMFGYVLYFPRVESALDHRGFKGLGVDPTDKNFDFTDFYAEMKRKKRAIKSVFLEQSVVTGLGNIYADEVCFASGVRPTRRAHTITRKEYGEIYKNIKLIIDRAIEMGGSSLQNYIRADGSRGSYALEHKVYGRAGKQCYRCKGELKGKIVAGRSTVYCSTCQK